MSTERKTAVVLARMSAALAARIDFVVNNAENGARSRSAVIRAALESWLPAQEKTLEKRLEELGAPSKKIR